MFLNVPGHLKELRFLQLTLFTILFLLAAPFLLHRWLVSILAEVFLLNSLLVSLSASGHQVRLKWPLWSLWGAGVLCYVLGDSGVAPAITPLLHLLDIIFTTVLLLGCFMVILAFIFQSHRVTVDTIFAAVMNYLLLAFIYAQFYQFLMFLEPRSFKLPAALVSPGSFKIFQMDMLYYSLVTITTLGYGDIVPQMGVARMTAVVEAVTGQLYVALLVAWLMGMFISQSLRSKQPGANENGQ